MSGAAWAWGLPAALAFFSALAGTLLVERWARPLGLLDLPNPRSSHREPRPRGGGLGIVCGVAAGVAAASWTAGGFGASIRVVLWAALLVAAAGLWDDLRPLPAWPRLLVQTAAAVLVVAACGGLERLPLPPPADVALGAAGAPLAVLWLVAVTNFFNFMDGLDALAPGQAVLSLALLAWALWPGGAAGLSLVAAAATAALLLRNWTPARLFLGDVGSSFLGLLLAGLPFAGPPAERPRLVLLVAVSLALFLLDPVATLWRRWRRGAPLTVAHREHAYQRLVAPERSHAPVVSGLLATGLLLSLLAAAGYALPSLAWPVVAAALLLFAAEWCLAARWSSR
ncbi:MAG TPA: glycosyl transferase [Thermoanaerobaculia bacterium]